MIMDEYSSRAGKRERTLATAEAVAEMIRGFSIEVMPRTAAKIENFCDILPQGTRVYVAMIEGTPLEDMVATAKRIRAEGFPVMPHIPARLINGRRELADLLRRYSGEANVDEALILGGGAKAPVGEFQCAMQLLETELFTRNGFNRIHIAGHPEGNRDIDPRGGTASVDAALASKHEFLNRTDAKVAIVTQFLFEAAPASAWMRRIKENGIDLPVHLGVAGPAKLQLLLKFAMSCGVGASLRVLKRRARDIPNLLRTHEPTELIADVAGLKMKNEMQQLVKLHLFPLGGIKASARWAAEYGGHPNTLRTFRK